MTRFLSGALLTLFCCLPASAQQSATYRLEEHSFNAGGHPENGATPGSASFGIRLDAIGDAVSADETLSSATYSMEAGFTSPFRPPAAVSSVRLVDHQTLVWAPEGALGSYNLYRDLLGSLGDLGYGSCEQRGLTEETATDPDEPAAGDGYFYLVTAENLLGEEGSKGIDSDGVERGNDTPCP